MLHCTLGAHVRLRVHLKLDLASTVSGKIPNSNGIKTKCTRKLFPQNFKLLHHQCLFRATFNNVRQAHLYDIISFHKR